MARKKRATKSSEAAATTLPTETTTLAPAIEPTALISGSGERDAGPPSGTYSVEVKQHEGSTTRTDELATSRTFAADPRPVMTVNLCGYSGGPTAHLQRSYRFKQMQIQFDQGQPEEPYLTMLKRAGWLDRTESEGVWTKQIDQNARWQSVDRIEQEFKSVANAIRKERGLEPVLQSLALA
jgi:hypothetical protein